MAYQSALRRCASLQQTEDALKRNNEALQQWQKLDVSFVDRQSGDFNVTILPLLYEAAKFDVAENYDLAGEKVVLFSVNILMT